MYDYKFRQDELRLRKPNRTLRRVGLTGAGIAIIGGTLLTLVQLFPGSNDRQALQGADSDVIPLTLPPRSGTERDPQETPPAPEPAAEQAAGAFQAS
jgi:hypothetical protein